MLNNIYIGTWRTPYFFFGVGFVQYCPRWRLPSSLYEIVSGNVERILKGLMNNKLFVSNASGLITEMTVYEQDGDVLYYVLYCM